MDTALFSKGLTPKPLSIWTLVCSRALHRAQYTVESSAISALSPFVSWTHLHGRSFAQIILNALNMIQTHSNSQKISNNMASKSPHYLPLLCTTRTKLHGWSFAQIILHWCVWFKLIVAIKKIEMNLTWKSYAISEVSPFVS